MAGTVFPNNISKVLWSDAHATIMGASGNLDAETVAAIKEVEAMIREEISKNMISADELFKDLRKN